MAPEQIQNVYGVHKDDDIMQLYRYNAATTLLLIFNIKIDAGSTTFRQHALCRCH